MNNTTRLLPMFLSTIVSKLPRSRQLRSAFGLVALAMTTCLMLSPGAHAQGYIPQALHQFSFGSGDGAGVYGRLINVNGVLYGTTQGGGSGNAGGTIFAINPDGSGYHTLYSFQGRTNDGGDPLAGLTYVNGVLYGTTAFGGNDGDNDGGKGTVFCINLDGTGYQVLYKFGGTSDEGERPQSTLVLVNGILYGNTSDSYAHSTTEGTIFSVDPTTHAVAILYHFQGMSAGDGAGPVTDMVLEGGKLYGTTYGGGANGYGTIYSFDPATNTETTLYSFLGADGQPLGPLGPGGLVDVGGKLYGTTEELLTEQGGTNGYGKVYSFDPTTNAVSTIHDFTSTIVGNDTVTSLTNVGGVLYGQAAEYDSNNIAYSVLYYVNTDGTGFQVHYSFKDSSEDTDGIVNLLDIGGTLYGMAGAGLHGDGLILSLTPIFPPVAHNDGCTITRNTARTNAAPGVLANDYNGNSNTLTAKLVTGTAHGSVSLHSDGSFTYTPKAGYVGPDSFTYQDSNTMYQGSTATVTLTVGPATPIAHNDSCAINYNTARTHAAPGVLANDDNGGEGPLTAVLVKTTSHGALTLKSDGSFTYTPNKGYVGTDSFTYKPVNPVGAGTVGTVTLTVQATSPTAHNDACTIAHNTTRTNVAPGVLANDDNGGGGSLTATLVKTTSHGTLTLKSDGSFTYTPNTGYSGTDTFTYQAVNSVGKSNVATVTLTVQ